jgi:hypothetical protein
MHMPACKSLRSAIIVVMGIWLANNPSLAVDCAQGDALNCYTQALMRLQAAQDALVAARDDISALQSSIGVLKAKVEEANARITALTTQITQVGARTVAWDKGNKQHDPPIGQPPFNGVKGAGNAGPGQTQSYPHCSDGYVAVGLYLDREPPGLNDARLECAKLVLR